MSTRGAGLGLKEINGLRWGIKALLMRFAFYLAQETSQFAQVLARIVIQDKRKPLSAHPTLAYAGSQKPYGAAQHHRILTNASAKGAREVVSRKTKGPGKTPALYIRKL